MKVALQEHASIFLHNLHFQATNQVFFFEDIHGFAVFLDRKRIDSRNKLSLVDGLFINDNASLN
jgi:hypothetical protein